MSRIEVLVACMHQKDDSLYQKMNLHTDTVLANQCDTYTYDEYRQADGNLVKLVSTHDRGVGKNRNKALMFATGEILMCADQDMVYVDNYAQIVEKAFCQCPKADIIVFRLQYLNTFIQPKKSVNKIKKVRLWNSLRYGTARVAIRKSAIDKACLSFSTLYGGGAKYSSGEDSLFIREALRKGLKMYASPEIIAQVKQETSSWFKGYDERYFIDKGILIANAFPALKHLLIYYYSYTLRKRSKDFGFIRIYKLMKLGYKEFKNI